MTLNDPPWEAQMEILQTINVPDIMSMILKDKFKEIQLEKYNGSTFCPWVTLNDPPREAKMKNFQTQNVANIIQMILKEK